MKGRLRIVVGGYIGLLPAAGVTWDYVQYPAGFAALGHDVFYLEDTRLWPIYQPAGSDWGDCSATVSHLAAVMEAFGLADRWAYRDEASGRCFGLSEERLREVCAMDEVELTDDMVRDARHAYLGSVSYVDDHLARLLEILRVTGRLENTVVILTSDHGDMQGERGLWYKMSFFEGSARVPLVVSAPARFATRRVSSPVSTMDLLPTLVGVAGGDDSAGALGDLDAESLLPLLRGDHDDRETVVGEYLAEGAIAPLVMVRRGSWKLVHSPVDPDQLYDLATDPLERVNRVYDPEAADVLADLRAEVARRWDLERIDGEVRESQRRRRTVVDALTRGTVTSWDYAPPYDASRRYIRNHLDLGELEAVARYPSVRQRPEQPEP